MPGTVIGKGLLFGLLITVCQAVQAEVMSETLIFLEPDGASYLQQRTIRSGFGRHSFHLDKKIQQTDLNYISPGHYIWDDTSSPESNILIFDQGDFTVIHPGKYESPALVVQDDGTMIYKTRDDKIREDGHFGMWYEPGNYTEFSYAWIFPDNIELLDYQSNREGEWSVRNNTLTFHAMDTNDLTFKITYRQKDTDADGIFDIDDQCPGTPANNPVAENGCTAYLDDDKDGVINQLDQCKATAAGQLTDNTGCTPDTDHDGISDGLDQCPATPAGMNVDSKGCEKDQDKDGVIDRLDQCKNSPAGVPVDNRGCLPDRDHDGVPDHLDNCNNTEEQAKVGPDGCELDSDQDGIFDHMDTCPETVAGAIVDLTGCEIDCDGDGVRNSADQCPRTPEKQAVDQTGCSIDDDIDGIINSRDLCPSTASGVKVDDTGCPANTAILLEGVTFLSNSAKLTENSLKILDNTARLLKQHADLKLEIAGHTDNQGAATYNKELSRQRAEAVKTYLLSRGVTLPLQAKGYGEEKPVADNTTETGRAKNRRVELIRLQ